MKTTDEPIIVEQIFNTSRVRLWKAITGIEEMRSWFFENIKDFNAKVGFETQFEVRSGKRIFTHQWRITEVIPSRKITYGWSYKEYDGNSFVTFDLFDDDEKTKLKLSVKVTEDFPADIPEFTSESCHGGWNYFIVENLKNYIELDGS